MIFVLLPQWNFIKMENGFMKMSLPIGNRPSCVPLHRGMTGLSGLFSSPYEGGLEGDFDFVAYIFMNRKYLIIILKNITIPTDYG